MILKENYEERHIRELQAASKGDPGLIERALYAFGLLEALAVVGLDFTFKGGTSLLLLLPKPQPHWGQTLLRKYYKMLRKC